MYPRLQVLTGATALIGEDLEVTPDAVVVIEDEAIVAAGASARVETPGGAQVIDLSTLTLAPGFIDAHVHIGFYEPSEVLARGVTTVRDLGWPPQEIFPLVHASRAVDFDGPSILAAGPILTARGGYPTRAAWAPDGTGQEVADATEAAVAVADVVASGATVIKVALNPPVGPTLDLDTLTAIVQHAQEHGLKVTGHIHDVEQLDKALAAGVNELAHMLLADEPIPDDTIAKMVAASITVVPTLAVFSGSARATAIRNLARFIAAGGNVVYGTDLGNEGPRPGIDAAEVAGMHEAGMTGIEIVRSATVDAARHLGLRDTGLIAPGMAADLVAIEGDPLNDPRDLTRVHSVWRHGRPRAG